MELFDRLHALGERAVSVVANLESEEATKTALVLPFLQALGYDVFDPTEVIPEFTADVGIKRGEKVDYAICRDGAPVFLIECKPHGAKLDRYSSQLYRYFSVTKSRVAILTDGIEYRFYSDLIEPNKLDEQPFLTLNIINPKRASVEQVGRLSKALFDLDSILAAAEDLRYVTQIRAEFSKQLDHPSDEFVRVLVDPLYDGRMMQSVVDRFRGLVKASLRSHIADAVDTRLRTALESNQNEQDEKAEESEQADEKEAVVTTAEELEGLYAVRAILADLVDPERLKPRDVRSYFGILLDDNNRKPVCRLWFNGRKRHLGVFDETKTETRIEVSGPIDLFKHAEAIRASATHAISR